MRDTRVRAVLIAVYRWNQRKRTFVHVSFARWHCRCEASVEQTVILTGLLTARRVRTKHRNDFIVQSADVVNHRIHRQIRWLRLGFMLLAVYPNAHRRDIFFRHPQLLCFIVFHYKGQIFGILLRIYCMRDTRVRAVLIAVYRWNQRKRTFVHVSFARWHCRCEASVEQTVILTGLLTARRVRTKHRNDFIVQSADVVNRRIHQHLRWLRLGFVLLAFYKNKQALGLLFRHPHSPAMVVFHHEYRINRFVFDIQFRNQLV